MSCCRASNSTLLHQVAMLTEVVRPLVCADMIKDGSSAAGVAGASSPNKRKASRDPSPERATLEQLSPNKPSRLRTTFQAYARQA